ncbi:uncharacterized protein LAESUDRAFT_629066, partial [Laetiporus sulphureus 93-53]
YPIMISQVNSADEQRVVRWSTKGYTMHSGFVVPDDWRFSTIVQFRAIDYGMELCELKLNVSPASVTMISELPFTLELYRLRQSTPLDSTSLNYRNKPPRVSKIASVQIDSTSGGSWHRTFACKMDEVLSFEIACQPPVDKESCRVEWWQNKSHPASG